MPDPVYTNTLTGERFFELPQPGPAAAPLVLPAGWRKETTPGTGLTYFVKPVRPPALLARAPSRSLKSLESLSPAWCRVPCPAASLRVWGRKRVTAAGSLSTPRLLSLSLFSR